MKDYTETMIAYFVDTQHMVITLQGELRFCVSDKLESAFILLKEQWSGQKLMLDLTQAGFIDSTIYGLIACYALDFEKLASSQMVIYYEDKDIHTELHTLGIDQLCLLKAEPSSYNGLRVKFTEVDKPDVKKEQLKMKVHQAHQALAHLTDDPAMQAVVDTIRNQNKEH